MSRFLRFGAFLCVLFFSVNAFAAGYSCPTYKKYTSCSSGYYMTQTSSSTACYTTAVAGNACRPCSTFGSSYTCAGGTACPQASTISVSYNLNGGSGTTPGATTCNSGASCSLTAGSATTFYKAGYYLAGWSTSSSATSGSYSITASANTTVYAVWKQCSAGTYHPAATGTAANSCPACSGGTQFQDAAGQSSCKNVSAGYYKSSNSAQAQCPANYRSGAAASEQKYCKASCSAGTRVASANAACTGVGNGNYIAAHTVNYGSTSAAASACTNKPANSTYTGAAGTNSCPWSCSAGYTGTSASGSTSCTVCPAGKYCTGGTASANCPAGTYRSSTGGTSSSSCTACSGGTQYQDATGQTSCKNVSAGYYKASNSAQSQCPANYRSGAAASAQSGCQTSCANGTYVATANAACTAVGAGYYRAAHSVNYGSTSTRSGCPSAYPNSDSGAAAITSCYSNSKSRAWSGTQTACAKPTNCYSVSCNSCSGSACSYVAYSNSAGNGDGTIKSGCSTNNAACQQTVGSVTANANYYVSGTSCAACSGLASGFYPNSAAGNSGGASVCKTNNISGQYVASANATSATNCGAGKYKAAHQVAYGSTSSCSTASAGYYAPGPTSAAQTQCVAGSYSAAGASGCTACGAGKTSSAGATSASACTSCTAITNLNTWASSSWNTNNTMSNLCTVATCNGSSYKNGNACPTCPSGYSANTSTGKTAASQCQIKVAGGKYIAKANESAPSGTCAAGTAKAEHLVNYGSTSSCDACTTRTKFSAAGAAACSTVSGGYFTTGCNSSNNNCTGQTQCSGATWCSGGVQNNCPTQTSGWTRNGGTGWTAVTQCNQTKTGTAINANCSAGVLKQNATSTTAWGATTIATALSAKAGAYVNGQTCTQCTGATYSAGGTATGCSTCPSIYTANTTAGKSLATQCQITTTAGKYIKTANDSAQTTCEAKYYCPSATVNYGSTNTPTACPAADANTAMTSYPDNYYNPTRTNIAIQGWSTGLGAITSCSANYSFTSSRGSFTVESVYYNSTTKKYDTGGSKYHTSIAAGYYADTQLSSTYCNTTTNRMLYKNSLPCPAGSYCPGYTSMPVCSSGTYETAIGKNACPTNYGNSPEISSAATQCYLNTTAGKFVKTANAAQETCTAGGYCPGSVKVNYGSTGGRTACAAGTANATTGSSAASACTTCANWTYSAAGAASCTNCAAVGDGWTKVSGTGWTSYANCKGTKTGTAINANCSAGVLTRTQTSASAWGNPTITTALQAKGGSIVSGQTCAVCAAGKWSAGGTATSCGSCPAAETGWTMSTATGLSAITQCTETTTPSTTSSPIASICTAGTLTKKATSATAWGAATASGLTAKAGRYVNGTTCSACGAGTYTSAATTATSCTAASKGYYVSGTEQTSQTACAAGTYTSATGQSSCANAAAGTYTTGCNSSATACTGTSVCADNKYSDAKASVCSDCATAKGYTNSGTTAASHAGLASCRATCGGAQYVATAGAGCVSVGDGYWGAGGTVAQNATLGRTQCPANYRNGTAASAESGCKTSCAAGTRVATANAACAAITSGNVYMLAHSVNYGSTSAAATACPASYTITGTTQADHDAKSDCKITCSGGTQVATADAACTTPTGSWYAASHTVSAGSTSGSNVKACLTNYATPNTTTATDHDAAADCKISCGAGTRIASANATSCTTPSGNWYVGAHTVSQGSASSVNSCLANYVISGTAATDHDAENDCKISCGGGSYIATARSTSCSNVGAGYWAAASTVSQGNAGTRNACATGLTTIGFGAGADEADDCGRILNVGDDKIYLRSAKKTTPSLNVGINGTTYYGNMGTAAKGTLRIQSGGNTYSVYDDSK